MDEKKTVYTGIRVGSRPKVPAPPQKEVVTLKGLPHLKPVTRRAPPLVMLVDNLIILGVNKKATEIRILTDGTVECNPGTGVIEKLKPIPPRLVPSVRSRLKIMGYLSISTHLRAQVGKRRKIRIVSKNCSLILRIVSTIEAPGEVVAIHY